MKVSANHFCADVMDDIDESIFHIATVIRDTILLRRNPLISVAIGRNSLTSVATLSPPSLYNGDLLAGFAIENLLDISALISFCCYSVTSPYNNYLDIHRSQRSKQVRSPINGPKDSDLTSQNAGRVVQCWGVAGESR